MLWCGNISFCQHIPSKHHRFGLKLFALCDCKTGFVQEAKMKCQQVQKGHRIPAEKHIRISESGVSPPVAPNGLSDYGPHCISIHLHLSFFHHLYCPTSCLRYSVITTTAFFIIYRKRITFREDNVNSHERR